MVHYWAGAFRGRIGWLVGPTGLPKTKLRPWMPFALDNDAFSAWSEEKEWDEAAWVAMMDSVRYSGFKPLWTLVPDVVADRVKTLQKWDLHAPTAAKYGWPLAFAVQDGMTPDDVPDEAEVIFVGGGTRWKWRFLPMWMKMGRRVHVGRVNELQKLIICENLGVESVDGTGWFRGTDGGRQAQGLQRWIEGIENDQIELDIV